MAICKGGYFREARKLVGEMTKRGLRPDKFTYTTLLDGSCKEGDLELGLEMKEEMEKEGIQLDNVAFTAIISGLCRDGKIVDAERTLREMLRAGPLIVVKLGFDLSVDQS
ncbi:PENTATRICOPEPTIDE REPEAT-CONTAINING PROTEIN-RELATED [Salix koriyanagi]|uniref:PENTATRICOPEPTIDE REPEAT-CONTAINING PROTEIN-RELATED n=1 Tax=Salix koriyanagi TaxID=2511006 RepID=A0A9Q0VR15_9ROSI|nr:PENTATRICOPEPTIDE REPEAT-CONTAINING PROTEIN-RELATED [Salix koriyanagi]